MRATTLRLAGMVLLVVSSAAALAAQQAPPPPLVTSQEILGGLTPDGSRWLTFGGNYTNQRHSPLTQITPANLNRLVPQWTFQSQHLLVPAGTTLTAWALPQ